MINCHGLRARPGLPRAHLCLEYPSHGHPPSPGEYESSLPLMQAPDTSFPPPPPVEESMTLTIDCPPSSPNDRLDAIKTSTSLGESPFFWCLVLKANKSTLFLSTFPGRYMFFSRT